jgi:hypothetical protein
MAAIHTERVDRRGIDLPELVRLGDVAKHTDAGRRHVRAVLVGIGELQQLNLMAFLQPFSACWKVRTGGIGMTVSMPFKAAFKVSPNSARH